MQNNYSDWVGPLLKKKKKGGGVAKEGFSTKAAKYTPITKMLLTVFFRF